jgi:signal transduction histidine kinase/DNA-binding NarL/FixJ family response regulator
MSRRPWHILLIEDNPEDCADLRQMLLRGGSRRYRFSEARLGAEGVQLVLDPQTGPVDCVLLDYDLPDMNAHGVLAALRQETGMPPCPVVVVTGMAIEEGGHLLGAGAQDYIGKRWASADSLTHVVESAVERFALLTERRSAQEALRTSEERYRALFDSIDAGYAVIELSFDDTGTAVDARYLQVNPAFEQQTGLHGAQGQTLHGLIPDIEDFWLQTYASVASTGVPLRMERHSEALQRWFDVYAFRLGASHLHQVAVLFHDTTERKRVELALMAAKAEAEAANRAKSDFVLSMSHELRSPLSAMLGFAQLIEAGTPRPTPTQQDSVEQILGAGWYLLGLINEILDLSAIESGKTVMASQSMALQGVLDDCRAMIEAQAQGAGIRVAFPAAEVPCFVQADPTRMKQVLINLLSNAIKYNRSAGQVTVSCTLTPGQRVRVSVEDTGAGLSAAQIAQLFEPFNRLGRESGAEPGTGIGLVICKRLVELMGGSIGVHSTPGVGSCFWFEIDAAPPPVADRLVPVHTVLHVEEDASRQQRLEKLLARRPGACLLRAHDIRAGIKMARSARPNLILIGVGPADPGGRQALQWLAREPSTAHIPVIALGADAAPGDVEAALAAGYSGFLTEPLQSDAFVDALDRALQKTNHGLGQRAAPQETARC